MTKRDEKRDMRAKEDSSLVKEVAPNTGVLNKEGADAGDNDDDEDDDDDVCGNESPPIQPQETPDTKLKLQPELETPRQQPIPVYDAATEARKAELDEAAKKYMADK